MSTPTTRHENHQHPAGLSNSPSVEDSFRIAVDSIPELVWTSRSDGHIDFLNQRWREYTGLNLEEASGWGWQQAVLPQDLVRLLTYWNSILASGEPGETEARLRRHDGDYRWFLFRAIPLRDAAGAVLKWYGTNTDIEDRKRAEALLAGEKQIFEMIAKSQPLCRTLDALCHLVGELSPGSLCSILLLDWDEYRFRHGAAPTLPDSYNRAMDGRVFEFSSGACARAARQGEQVIVPDIAADPLWEELPDLPLSHGLKACWSSPVFAQDGKVIGVFATYSRTPCLPTAHQLHLIDQLTDITSIAIERDRAASALQASEHLARGQLSALTHTLAELSQETQPEKLLEHVLHTINRQLGAHGLGVWEMVETIGRVQLLANYEDETFHLATPEQAKMTQPMGPPEHHPIWTVFFKSGEHCVLGDLEADPPRVKLHTPSDQPWHPWMGESVDNPEVREIIARIVQKGIVATLCVPILIAGKVLGLISIRFRGKRSFHFQEIELARALAHQAMLAIQIIRLTAQSRDAAVMEERNRLARDIHDTLAQGFTGIIVQLDAAEDATAKGMRLESDAHVARASELARDSLGEARRSVRALRPLALEDKTLPDALETLFLKMTVGTSLQLNFSVHGASRKLPPEWEENLLRIGQEVLHNALRHSEATRFDAAIAFTPDGFFLELSDDGRGFNPNAIHDGFGLIGIQERVERMTGKLLIRSALGEGTRVRIDLSFK
ncbi:MAG: GAF domain-containing protein [Drouetiella hepatica Uher 2000/2452]|jgi:PAS domain S-box-containing protein|uniref:GAF domain-containing protein n=1 Tax=Drouetiella hepatica Uher 2000/2452 TaxID=904376 RepID=A0A951QI15_9CYAN|nr:GAF domain-containing protein [Drouetiella hepatica Uher 2000/2452]